MLGGGDTSASVLGSRTGVDASAAGTVSSSGDRNGSNGAAAGACAGNMFGSNGNTSKNSGEDDRGRVDDGERSFGGNRWPRQETLALLKIRSDMDVTFREGSVKGPLWEEVSRKLAELGYHRNAKKCREKFENVYKYHKRTKDGRGGNAHGAKTYRFFDQLQAFHNHPSIQSPQSKPAMAAAATNPPSVPQVNVPSTTLPSLQQNILLPSFPSTNPNPTSQIISLPPATSPSISPADLMSNSTSSSSSSDLGLEGHRKRKRKWKDLFERLMKEVVEKQEQMHKNFLEAIEKRERERMAREEAWRMQEMSRLNREREILAHQRSIAAAQDAAVMAFLQNLSEQRHPNQETNPLPPQQQQQQQQQQAPSKPASAPPPPDNGDQSYRPSSSRWPKVEIEALIKIRSNLEAKYEDSGPKGPLWEDISAAMKRLGYNRNAKRCKEKWENINKYFKKVKESNKKRPEDSKTCPYFQQLDALYREKNKPQSSAPLLVRPEQQWPPPHQGMEDMESDQNQEEDDKDCGEEEEDDKDCGEEEEDDKDCDEEEEDEGGSFEIVASKPASMGTDE